MPTPLARSARALAAAEAKKQRQDHRIPKCICGNNLSRERQEEGKELCPACDTPEYIDLLLREVECITDLEGVKDVLRQMIKELT